MTEADRDKDDSLSDAEVEAREEATLRTLLATPPKPHKTMPKRRVESQSK
jgi:hypothetical protein